MPFLYFSLDCELHFRACIFSDAKYFSELSKLTWLSLYSLPCLKCNFWQVLSFQTSLGFNVPIFVECSGSDF